MVMKMENCAISRRKALSADDLCHLFLVFLAGCLVGWIYEEIFYWITEGLLRNRGILYGPWLPIYGIGALGIYALKPLKGRPALLGRLPLGGIYWAAALGLFSAALHFRLAGNRKEDKEDAKHE